MQAALFELRLRPSVSDKPYDKMTHDEILREHGASYAQMSPGERTKQGEGAREVIARERGSGRLSAILKSRTRGPMSSTNTFQFRIVAYSTGHRRAAGETGDLSEDIR
jgi:hypothetical protein